jgi:hypothetical protein
MRRLPALAALAAVVSVAGLLLGSLVFAPAGAAGRPTAAATYTQLHRVIGHSVKGRPINAYFRGDPQARLQVVLVGQIHGDEKAGVTTARYVLRHLRPRAGTGLWIVPTMNPDGNARNTRQNASGVDLNRNWPTNGWRSSGRGGCCWGGRAPGGAPEVKAMIAFFGRVRPDFVVVIHQPLHVVAENGKNPRYEHRLARQLGLPLQPVPVGVQGPGIVSPTLSDWYNHKHRTDGTSVTVEYGHHPSWAYKTRHAGNGILKAMLVWRAP